MSEDAARALIHLGNSIAAGEDNRQRVLDQLSKHQYDTRRSQRGDRPTIAVFASSWRS